MAAIPLKLISPRKIRDILGFLYMLNRFVFLWYDITAFTCCPSIELFKLILTKKKVGYTVVLPKFCLLSVKNKPFFFCFFLPVIVDTIMKYRAVKRRKFKTVSVIGPLFLSPSVRRKTIYLLDQYYKIFKYLMAY